MRKKLVCFLLGIGMGLSLLSGCGKDRDMPTAASGVDYNQYNNSYGFYALTDSAYIVWQDKLYFLEPSLKAPMTILCSRANCMHNSAEECSAYLPGGTGGIFAWNEGLYYITAEYTNDLRIYRMDVDGQNRQQVAKLAVDTDASFYTYQHDMRCGHLVLNFVSSTPSGDVSVLYLFSMENLKEEPVVLFSNEELYNAPDINQEEIPHPVPMWITEDWLFYLVEQGPKGDRQNPLYGYQISTGGTRQFLEDGYYTTDDLAIDGEMLYWFDHEGILTAMDLVSGDVVQQTEIPLDAEEYGEFDDRWLYIYGGNAQNMAQAELTIYDYEGNEIQRLSCAELDYPLCYAFSTEDRVFFRNLDYSSYFPVAYLEKDAIASGTATLHSLI